LKNHQGWGRSRSEVYPFLKGRKKKPAYQIIYNALFTFAGCDPQQLLENVEKNLKEIAEREKEKRRRRGRSEEQGRISE
jgi:ribosomal protein S7